MADALFVACGETALPDAGMPLETVRVPARPGRDGIDPVLDRLGDRRLLVAGTDADLAAVTLRLLRTERLGSVSVGFIPAGGSVAAETFGLPWRPDQALRLALHGDVDPVPLIRDDAGGVIVGRGVLRRLRGVVYCDDDRVLRGTTPRLEVSPDSGAGPDTSVGGLIVRVWRGGLFRRGVRESRGRAVQIGCSPNRPVSDGVEHERPVRRWTWYRHTENLRLVRGLI
jgi:hypothetical protein